MAEARAKAVCATCPYRLPCLAYALATRQIHGIWGGLTETERRQCAPRTCPRCGTPTPGRNTYCSDPCRSAARAESRAAADEMRAARRPGEGRGPPARPWPSAPGTYSHGGGLVTAAAVLAETSDTERGCRLVPCERCGAEQHQACAPPGGQSHGARRLLAVERGHLDPDTGAWLTRWLS